jgi:hypothetical protein
MLERLVLIDSRQSILDYRFPSVHVTDRVSVPKEPITVRGAYARRVSKRRQWTTSPTCISGTKAVETEHRGLRWAGSGCSHEPSGRPFRVSRLLDRAHDRSVVMRPVPGTLIVGGLAGEYLRVAEPGGADHARSSRYVLVIDASVVVGVGGPEIVVEHRYGTRAGLLGEFALDGTSNADGQQLNGSLTASSARTDSTSGARRGVNPLALRERPGRHSTRSYPGNRSPAVMAATVAGLFASTERHAPAQAGRRETVRRLGPPTLPVATGRWTCYPIHYGMERCRGVPGARAERFHRNRPTHDSHCISSQEPSD